MAVISCLRPPKVLRSGDISRHSGVNRCTPTSISSVARTLNVRSAISAPDRGSKSGNGALYSIASPIRPVTFHPEQQEALLHSVADLPTGILVSNGQVYRDLLAVRCYEVGMSKTASIETMANMLQESAANHMRRVFKVNNSFGMTQVMLKHRLISVLTRMHVEMYKYPEWGDVVEIDTWFQLGKNMQVSREWIIRMASTGDVLGACTSQWVLMNRDTRRLSRFPDDLKVEVWPHALHPPLHILPHAVGPSSSRIPKFDEQQMEHVVSNLSPRRSDLDMNQHVNNVTYVAWTMESLPQDLIDTHEIAQLTMEYRRECHRGCRVEAMSREWDEGESKECDEECEEESGSGHEDGLKSFVHILRFQDNKKEINRAHTLWRSAC